MPEFPWRCPMCGSDEVDYAGCWGGGGWMDWFCRAGGHTFCTVQY